MVGFILVSSFVLFFSTIISGNISSTYAAENTVSGDTYQLSVQEQKELDKFSEIMKKSIVKDKKGIYKFDSKVAKKLGLSDEQIKDSDNLFNNVLSQQDLRQIVGDDNNSTLGKGSMTAKALIIILKKYSKKIDSAIDKGIDLLPFVKSSTKQAWKKALTTVALIKVLDNFIGVTDTAENLVKRGIITLIPGMPDWAATGIAKTLMMVLPI